MSVATDLLDQPCSALKRSYEKTFWKEARLRLQWYVRVSGIWEAKQQVGKSEVWGARWLGCESWLSHLMVIDKLFSLSVPQFLHIWNGLLRGVHELRHITCLVWWLAHGVRNYYISFILNFWVNLKFKIKFVLENPVGFYFKMTGVGAGG